MYQKVRRFKKTKDLERKHKLNFSPNGLNEMKQIRQEINYLKTHKINDPGFSLKASIYSHCKYSQERTPAG